MISMILKQKLQKKLIDIKIKKSQIKSCNKEISALKASAVISAENTM